MTSAFAAYIDIAAAGTADSQLASRLALEDELASEATTAAVPVIDGSTDAADTRLVPQ